MTPSLLEFTPEVTGQVFRGRDVSPTEHTRSSRLPYISPKTIHEYAGFGSHEQTRELAKLEPRNHRQDPAFMLEDGESRGRRLDSLISKSGIDDGRETPKHSTFSAATTAVGPDMGQLKRFGGVPPRSFELEGSKTRGSPIVVKDSDFNKKSQSFVDDVVPQASSVGTAETAASPPEATVRFEEMTHSSDAPTTPRVNNAGSGRTALFSSNHSCPGSIIILKSRKMSSLVQRDALLRDAFRLSPIDPHNTLRQPLPFRRRRRTLSEDGHRTVDGGAELSWREQHDTPQLRATERETSVPLILDTSSSPSPESQSRRRSITSHVGEPLYSHTDAVGKDYSATGDVDMPSHSTLNTLPDPQTITPPLSSTPPVGVPLSREHHDDVHLPSPTAFAPEKETSRLPQVGDASESSIGTTASLHVEEKSTPAPPVTPTDASATNPGESSALENGSISTTAPEWVQVMCSESFRDFVIEKILEELEALIGMLRPDTGDDQSAEVVSAAQILTWSPVKIAITSTAPPQVSSYFPPPSPPISKRDGGMIKEKRISPQPSPQYMSLEGSPTLESSPLWSETTVQRGSGPVNTHDSRILCCVRSPSYYMFNRLRRWLTPVNTPYEGAEVASASSSSSSSTSAENPGGIPAPIAPWAPTMTREALCYGMLSGCFGLLLFEADIERDICRLADVIPFGSTSTESSETLPQLEVLSETTLIIRFRPPGFKPPTIRNMPLKFRHEDSYIQSITLDYGTPQQLKDWLSQLAHQLTGPQKDSTRSADAA